MATPDGTHQAAYGESQSQQAAAQGRDHQDRDNAEALGVGPRAHDHAVRALGAGEAVLPLHAGGKGANGGQAAPHALQRGHAHRRPGRVGDGAPGGVLPQARGVDRQLAGGTQVDASAGGQGDTAAAFSPGQQEGRGDQQHHGEDDHGHQPDHQEPPPVPGPRAAPGWHCRRPGADGPQAVPGRRHRLGVVAVGVDLSPGRQPLATVREGGRRRDTGVQTVRMPVGGELLGIQALPVPGAAVLVLVGASHLRLPGPGGAQACGPSPLGAVLRTSSIIMRKMNSWTMALAAPAKSVDSRLTTVLPVLLP